MHPYEMAQTMRERHRRRHQAQLRLALRRGRGSREARSRSGARETTREGRRPQRTVYEITNDGEIELSEWMAEIVFGPGQGVPALRGRPVLPPRPPARRGARAPAAPVHGDRGRDRPDRGRHRRFAGARVAPPLLHRGRLQGGSSCDASSFSPVTWPTGSTPGRSRASTCGAHGTRRAHSVPRRHDTPHQRRRRPTMTTPIIEAPAWPGGATARCRRWPASTSPPSPAGSRACSAPTAPARPPFASAPIATLLPARQQLPFHVGGIDVCADPHQGPPDHRPHRPGTAMEEQ